MKVTHLAAALFLSASTVAAAPMSPLALYQFENNVLDSSGNGNHGTIVGGVGFASSQAGFGMAGDFSVLSGLSGVNTGVDISYAALNSMTMGAWIYADTFGANNYGKFMSMDNGGFDRTLGFDARGDSAGTNVSAFTGSGVADIDGTATVGVWTHYAVVYDGTNSAIYQNGVLAETFTDATTNDTSIYDLFLGVNPGFNEDFDGRMDDAFVYGRALNSAEILDIYQNGFTAVPLPAGLPLLAAGLGTFVLVRRKSSSTT